MRYACYRFIKMSHLRLEYYIIGSIRHIIGFLMRGFGGSDDALDVMLTQIAEWDKESPMLIDHDDAITVVVPINESIPNIYQITKGTNELEFRFEPNMFVRIHRDGNKVKITIAQDANILMTIFDRSDNPEYIRWELERVYDNRIYATVADAVASVSLRGSFTYRQCVMQNGIEPIVVWRILHMHTNKQLVVEEDRQPIDLYEGAL